MTRLATLTPAPTPNTNKIGATLAHMDDCHPEDADRLREYLARPDLYAHQDIADALTQYARDNNLGTGISETTVRRYRKAQR